MTGNQPIAPCRITVATLAGDDVQALEDTLTIARSIGDELIVVDTGGGEQLLETAYQEGAAVLEHDWSDDYSAARNALHEQCKNDWILWLEAGETMDLQTGLALRKMLSELQDRTTAFMMLVENPPVDIGGASEQVGSIRLLPNHPAIHFTGRVRENANRSLLDNGLAIKGLPHHIRRSSTVSYEQIKKRRAQQDIRLAKMAIDEEGPQPRLLNCLGEACHIIGDPVRSRELFRQALEESQSGSSEMLEAYYGLLTSLDGDASQAEEQLSLCLRGLDVFPVDGQLLCVMGSYLQARGRLDLASRSYWTAFKYGTINPEVWHISALREVAAACHALTLQLQQKDEQALEFLQEAVTDSPESRRLARQLLELHIKLDQQDAASRLVDAVVEQPDEIETMRSVVRGACLARRQQWKSARQFLESAYRDGCRDPLCMRWLTMTLVNTGPELRAKELLREWRTLEPLTPEIQTCADAIAKHAAAGHSDSSRRIDSAPAGIPISPPANAEVDPTSIGPFTSPPTV